MATKNKLSVYLVKEGITSANDIFEDPGKIRVLERYSENSAAYFVPSLAHESNWLRNFFLRGGDIPVVKIIQEKKYDPLVGICAKDLCKEQNLALLEDIGERICECYAAEGPAIDGKVNAASDTLITKILLGTLGCVPAYDRYYKESVKKYHISSGKYNSDSVYRVAKFYCDHEDEFERLRLEMSERRIEYPPMKLMDMCFWQDAYISDSKAATIQRIE